MINPHNVKTSKSIAIIWNILIVIYFADDDLDQYKEATQGSYNRQKLQGRLKLGFDRESNLHTIR